MSDPVWPHGRQPTRLPRPWESPGKNTGVGCHFLLQCRKVKSESEVTQSCRLLETPWTAAYQAPPSMGSPGKSTGVGCHRLLQLLYLKWIMTRSYCVHRTFCSMVCGRLDGRGVWGRMDTAICVAELLCCSPETITTLLTGYSPI